jgi:serine/threonine-protein kinase
MPADSTRVDELLQRWQDAHARGEELTVQDLCPDDPNLASELQQKIAEKKAFQQADTRVYPSLSDPTVNDGRSPVRETLSAELKYSGLRLHGRGGLGVVFAATDVQMHREVAIKFINERAAEDPENRAQFLRESEVTSRLEHPGVVPVHGVGTGPDGRPFYVMRFIKGESLEAAICRFHQGRLNARDANLEFRNLLTRLISVCHTIAYAHNRGIIHRDIKPDNIMLGKYGETLVVDWGLAMPVDRDSMAKASGEKTLLLNVGHSSSSRGGGTPAYMSPEQAEGGVQLTPATDTYSLGVTLFKILTGEVPFKGQTHHEIRSRVTKGHFPKPRSVKKDVAAPLEAICLKAMAFFPGDRYPTPTEMAADLEHWLADEPVEAFRESGVGKVGRWFRHHRGIALAAGLSLMTIFLVTLVSAGWLASSAQRERAAREDNLRFAVKFAARSVGNDMDLRWRVLEVEAADPELSRLITEMNHVENDADVLDHPMRKKLQDWLAQRQRDHEDMIRGTSWFVSDVHGRLVAMQGAATRNPASFIGKRFAERDYFHGQGEDFDPKAVREIKPLSRPARSSVFRSRTDGKLKVAFSVPVRDGGKREGKVIGVLSMGVELGTFAALQTELGRDRLAVLVDLRADRAEGNGSGEKKRGLVLHHMHLVELYDAGESAPTIRVDPALLSKLQHLAEVRRRRDERLASGALISDKAAEGPEEIDRDYHDPVGGSYSGTWIAAFEPVVVHGQTDPQNRYPGWVVIVQERR